MMRVVWAVLFTCLVGAAAVPAFACACDRRAAAAGESKEASVTLAIDGMTCASCGVAVRTALERLDGVKSAAVSVADKRARVAYDAARVTPAKMVEAVEKLGYKARVEGKA